MMKFIETIQYFCALLSLSSVFIVALLRLFECETDDYWFYILVFISIFASQYIVGYFRSIKRQ